MSFPSFYPGELAINVTVDLGSLRAIRSILQNRAIIKGTIGPFLLNVVDFENQKLGLTRLLFEIYLSFTGMHSFTLLLYCAVKLNTPLKYLFGILLHPGTVDALKLASKLISTYLLPQTDEDEEALDAAKTWKYARIFDSQVFVVLQTKNCSMLTAILASLAVKCGTTASGSPVQIAQIASFIANNSDYFEDITQIAFDFCTSANWATVEKVSDLFKMVGTLEP